MPERQQTEGDFGYRPVKPQQQITDTYSKPTLPKPDLSVLEGIGKLSDTAFKVMDFQQKQEKFQKEAGKELGEADPDFKIGRGTTEAAMVGFQEGRGVTLRERFRTNVQNEWNIIAEENEELKYSDEAYAQFLLEKESQFVQDNQIEGIARTSFDSGRESWFLDSYNENALKTSKARKEGFLVDMKETTSSSINNMLNITSEVSKLSDEDVRERLQTLRPDAEFANDAESMRLARHVLIGESMRERFVAPIQTVLDTAYRYGGDAESKVKKEVAMDLINFMKTSEAPEVIMSLMQELRLGTGKFVSTNEYKSLFEENRIEIEDNILKSRLTYEKQIEYHVLASSINPQTSIEEFNKARNKLRSDIGTSLTEDQALKIEMKMLDNWDNQQKIRDDYFLSSAYQDLIMFESDEPTKRVFVEDAVAGLEEKGIKISAKQLLRGVEDTIFTMGKSVEDMGQRANFIVSTIQSSSVFTNQKATRVSNKIVASANKILSTDLPEDYTKLEEGLALYRASKSYGLLDSLGIPRQTQRLYNHLDYQILNEDMTFKQAVSSIEGVKSDFTADFDGVTSKHVTDAIGEEKSRGLRRITMEMAQAIQINTGLDPESAVERAVEVQENMGITTVGEGDGEHMIQLPRLTNQSSTADATFVERYQQYNRVIQAQVKEQYEEDKEILGAYVREITKKGGLYGNLESITGLTSEDLFIQAEGTKMGRSFLTGYETRVLRREYEELVFQKAIDLYEEKYERLPIQAQPLFKGIGLQDWDVSDIQIGLTSIIDPSQAPTYSIENLKTGVKLDTLAGVTLPAKMTTQWIVDNYDEVTDEYNNMLEEKKALITNDIASFLIAF